MKQYGLIGFPLKHSFSRQFFTQKFSGEGIDSEYINFEIPDIKDIIGIIKNNTYLAGLNVTIPYKESVLPFLNELDTGAKEIGAVNVIKIDRCGKEPYLTGYNSDIIGFQRSIAPLINKTIHKKALILGTGGASKAVEKGLKNIGIETTYVSRKKNPKTLIYEELNENIFEEYSVIVNSTPLGTFPNIDEAPNIPYQLLTPNHLLYDLVYNPAETKFLRMGKEAGAKIKNGAEMLELQALSAWDIWNK